MQAHVRLGREWHGSGQAHLVRGRIAGVEVAEWRLPFRFSYLPDVNSGQIRIDDSGLQVGAGRATVRLSAGWGAGVRLDGAIVFRAIEVRSLGQTFVALEHQLGSGRLSGRFDFAGQDVHALQDLNARLDVDFAQAQPLQLPVLSQITPYLRGVSTSTSFEKGDLRATLSRGIWRVRRLALLGNFANVFAEGTVIVQQGRLDLDVTARTGELIVNPVLLRLVSLYLGQPLSVEVLAQTSEWLSNRVVHLRVAGTIRNPDIHIERLRLLTDETIRFFFFQAARPSASPRTAP
jgi:translocation and assembly module TamB